MMEVWLGYKVMNIAVQDWLFALVIAAISYLAISNIWSVLIRRITVYSMNSRSQLDDLMLEVMRTTTKFTFALFSILIGMHFLDLSAKWLKRLDHLTFFVIGIQIAVWLSRGIDLWEQRRHQAKEEARDNAVITTMLSWIFKTTVWSILLLSILANVGVNITAFVASLGIGGVAIALAVQNILSDLFASLAIGLDKPFVLGDFIIFGDVLGTVEKVGLKTTHIRALGGQQIVIGNTELLKNTIHNYKRMAERRVVFKFRITYDTPVDRIEQVPRIVKEAVEGQKKTRFDRAHFMNFGESSLEFEVVYYVLDSDYNVYMDIQQAINLHIMRALQALEIKFAYPAMTVHLKDGIPFSRPVEQTTSMKSARA
jgi:small-conductance mechanosensitive channel